MTHHKKGFDEVGIKQIKHCNYASIILKNQTSTTTTKSGL